eukprot:m.64552 g.64552  ORF g.64552 m.64552 type:complete len:171 (-) comp14005_c0_seq1:1218-1730(-)
MAREVAAHDGYGPPELSSLSLSDTFAAAPVATPSISCQLNAETSPLCKEGLPLTYIVAGEEYTLTIAASQQGVYKTAVSLRVEDAIQATQSQEAVRDWQANHNQTPMLEIGIRSHVACLINSPHQHQCRLVQTLATLNIYESCPMAQLVVTTSWSWLFLSGTRNRLLISA